MDLVHGKSTAAMRLERGIQLAGAAHEGLLVMIAFACSRGIYLKP
jgi:hypothetical protein